MKKLKILSVVMAVIFCFSVITPAFSAPKAIKTGSSSGYSLQKPYTTVKQAMSKKEKKEQSAILSKIDKLMKNASKSEQKHLKTLKKELKNKFSKETINKVLNQLAAYKKYKSTEAKIDKLLKNASKSDKKFLKKLKKQLNKNKWNKGKVYDVSSKVNALNMVNKLLKKNKSSKSLEKMKSNLISGKEGEVDEIKMYNAFGKTGVDYMNTIYNSKQNKNGNNHYVQKSDIYKICAYLLKNNYMSKSQMEDYGDFFIDGIKSGNNPFELGQEEQATYYEYTKCFTQISNGLKDIAEKNGYKYLSITK